MANFEKQNYSKKQIQITGDEEEEKDLNKEVSAKPRGIMATSLKKLEVAPLVNYINSSSL